MIEIKCPTCKKQVAWSKDNAFRPFCSERCQLIDLGAWADGSYAIPTKESPTDDEENTPTTPPENEDE